VLLQGREPLRERRTGRKSPGEYCHWAGAATGGTSQGGSHCATTGGGNRGSTATGAHATGEYCHRGNVAGRKPLCYHRGRKQREYCYWGACHRGVLPPGERRRAEAIVLPPGAEAEGVLLLGRMPQGSTATGGTSQGGSHCITTGGTPQGAATRAYATGAGTVTGGSS